MILVENEKLIVKFFDLIFKDEEIVDIILMIFGNICC